MTTLHVAGLWRYPVRFLAGEPPNPETLTRAPSVDSPKLIAGGLNSKDS